LYSSVLSYCRFVHHLDLHSFPTRRSSDLMLSIVDLPETAIKSTTLTQVEQVIGKSPKIFLRAGEPINDTDVAQITLIDVPVLTRSEEHTSELQSRENLVCRLLLEKKKMKD